MNKIILSALLLFSFANANNGCELEQSGDVNVTWKAFKTLSKIGVQGVFTDVKYTPNKKTAPNFKELFIGSKISIDVSKIDSKHKDRDKTLVAMFFNQLKGGKIEGEIKSIEADKSKNGKRPYTGTLEVSLKMNGRTLLIPMKYQYKKGDFQAIGTIDIFDFEGNDALRSINKSCFDLHKGKTWSDVNIGFRTTIKATLCNTDLVIKKPCCEKNEKEGKEPCCAKDANLTLKKTCCDKNETEVKK